jgi:hypothetical protein
MQWLVRAVCSHARLLDARVTAAVQSACGDKFDARDWSFDVPLDKGGVRSLDSSPSSGGENLW